MVQVRVLDHMRWCHCPLCFEIIDVTGMNLKIIPPSEISQIKRAYTVWILLCRILEKHTINYSETRWIGDWGEGSQKGTWEFCGRWICPWSWFWWWFQTWYLGQILVSCAPCTQLVVCHYSPINLSDKNTNFCYTSPHYEQVTVENLLYQTSGSKRTGSFCFVPVFSGPNLWEVST